MHINTPIEIFGKQIIHQEQVYDRLMCYEWGSLRHADAAEQSD